MIAFTGIGKDFVPYSGRLLAEARCGVAGVRYYDTSIKGVIDVGAEKTRVVKYDAKGRIVDFASNDKCAAGTGIFLDAVSSVLQIEPWDSEALQKVEQGEISISSTCAVFAESEVISLIHSGTNRYDLWMAVNTSVASRVYVLINRLSLDSGIAMIGGVAKNPVLTYYLEKMLGCKLLVPPDPEFVTALGAAIIAQELDKC
jgi:predicted CoA-substrate-specific enzyme activase